MKAILREGIRENMTQNIRLYPELYPVQTTMDGCSPTEDACSSIAKYIECEYQNLGELEKCDFEEFKDLCIETAFSELELCDSSNEETGETRDYLFEEVNRYLEKETTNVNEKKGIDIYLDIEELMKSAEGHGFSGWICPVWAKIEDDAMSLSLGSPVSKGTSFVDDDGRTPLSWVGDIECWNRYWKADEAELWAKECHCNPEDFNSDDEMENEVNGMDLSDLESEIKESCIEYAKSKGYTDFNFI